MNEFERDNRDLRPEDTDGTPHPTEQTTGEAPTVPEETAEAAERAPETPTEDAPRSVTPEETAEKEEPFRDIYGKTYRASAPTPPKKKKRELKLSGSGLALLLVCCMLVSILAGAGINYMMNGEAPIQTTDGTTTDGTPTDGTTTAGGQSPDKPISPSQSGETAPAIGVGTHTGSVVTAFPEYEVYAPIANQCIQSVVVIRVTEKTIAYGQEYVTSGAGSGVIFDKNGYIVTNYHVVGDATESISVELYDGSVYEGRYIYGDEYVDLSVIKIEKSDCVAARIGDSSQMALGQIVVAIGNPLGYGLTVTPGVVSALQRSVTIDNTTMTLMQTSAAINSGNSGGGLFNLRGELIGIVNAKVGGTSVEGMGFAIPSTTVVKSLNDLKDYGYITGMARLGVTISTRQYQTWPYMQTHSYIQVVEINPNGSAAKSGLEIGDILYKFNGVEISSFDILSEQLTKYAVGDTVTLTIRRPIVELTNNNLSEYLSTSEEIELAITFVEFNPNIT